MTLSFHPLTIADRASIVDQVKHTECRNCDLNFMNLLSWRTLYSTEAAYCGPWLVFRFMANGQLAYLPPIGPDNWHDILAAMRDDAAAMGYPFMLLGVCEQALARLQKAMPDYFHAVANRNYTDYIYRRDALATLAGKKLQPKRNHFNRFVHNYPDYEFKPLTKEDFDDCLTLYQTWNAHKAEAPNDAPLSYEAEQRSLRCVLEHWDELHGLGGILHVGGKTVAFTYGAPINYDTFDVCMEKADPSYDGVFAAINREFVRTIPEQYTLINREEDLGIEGLRKAKLSYHPHLLLHKYTVTAYPTPPSDNSL